MSTATSLSIDTWLSLATERVSVRLPQLQRRRCDWQSKLGTVYPAQFFSGQGHKDQRTCYPVTPAQAFTGDGRSRFVVEVVVFVYDGCACHKGYRYAE